MRRTYIRVSSDGRALKSKLYNIGNFMFVLLTTLSCFSAVTLFLLVAPPRGLAWFCAGSVASPCIDEKFFFAASLSLLYGFHTALTAIRVDEHCLVFPKIQVCARKRERSRSRSYVQMKRWTRVRSELASIVNATLRSVASFAALFFAAYVLLEWPVNALSNIFLNIAGMFFV